MLGGRHLNNLSVNYSVISQTEYTCTERINMSIGFLSLLSRFLCFPADEMEAISNNQYVFYLALTELLQRGKTAVSRQYPGHFVQRGRRAVFMSGAQRCRAQRLRCSSSFNRGEFVKRSDEACELEVIGFVRASNTHSDAHILAWQRPPNNCREISVMVSLMHLKHCGRISFQAQGQLRTETWGGFCFLLSTVHLHEFHLSELERKTEHSFPEKTNIWIISPLFSGNLIKIMQQ